MENWTKLYQRILQSSVWKLNSDKKVLWITLLALKDKHGCVYGTPEWLADQAGIPDEECYEALKIFAAPDRRSRTPDFEGRKIESIPGGWKILNHFMYRDEMEDRRDYNRRAKEKQRAREKRKQKLATETNGEGNVAFDSLPSGGSSL